MKFSVRLFAACAMLAAGLRLNAAPHRRALLVGINDYTASTLIAHPRGAPARCLGTGAQPRGVKPDLRDVADGVTVPRPESRGALVLAAAQDVDTAWETRDAEGKFHGAFSWAWMRSMRDAASGEPAMETFLRAQARMRAETPFQQP